MSCDGGYSPLHQGNRTILSRQLVEGAVPQGVAEVSQGVAGAILLLQLVEGAVPQGVAERGGEAQEVVGLECDNS